MRRVFTKFKLAGAAVARKPFQWLLYLLLVAFFTHADILAGVIFVISSLLLRYLLIRRSETAFRRSIIGLVALLATAGLLAAIGMPTYRANRDRLLVPAASIREGSVSSRPGSFELTSDLMTTSPDAQAQIDSQAQYLSSLGMDGYFLNPDGSINATDNSVLLLHTHIADTRGLFLVQNYTANSAGLGAFDPATAQQVMTNPVKRSRLIKSIIDQAIQQHWDGVIMDFESLSQSGFGLYSQLVEDLRAKLPSGMQLGVDLPVLPPSPSAAYQRSYREIGETANFVNLMTYDLHVASTAPGPIGPLPWIEASVKSTESLISPKKIRIGAAAYAYVWGPLARQVGQVLSPDQAFAVASQHRLRVVWDQVSAEWHATAPDGSQIWIQDKTSLRSRIQLAVKLGVRGANLWELSRSQSLAGAALGVPVYRPYVATRFNRPVSLINSKGLVALTFDDGPDPNWTPKILSVLERLHVPATFFVIGQQAVDHADLVARAIRDGDIVGNHTYTHPDLATLSPWLAESEINAGSWVIKGITGMQPLLFRSPYGITDNLNRSKFSSSADLAQSMGLQEIGWNTDTFDWSRPGVAKIVSNATNAPNAEPIILLHDGGGNRAQTVAAIPRIVSYYKKLGYSFTTVDHLDGGVTYPYVIQRDTVVTGLDSVLTIAGFKLWLASRDIVGSILIAMAVISLLRLALGWVLASRYLKRRKAPDANDETRRISILIPAHNEQETITKTLASIAKTEYGNFEVIVAENGSSDNTYRLAAEFALQDSNFTVLKCRNTGKAAALNEALEVATGEVVIVLDADTVVSPRFCEAVIGHFEDPTVGAVAGNVKVGNRINLLTKLQALEYIFSLSLDRASQAQLGIVSVVPGAAGAFRKSAVVALGGWPTRTLVEDTDLTMQLHRAGWKIAYEPAAISLTESPQTLRDVVKQRSRWIYGTTQVAYVYRSSILDPGHGRLGLLALPWLVLTQVLLPVLGPLVDIYLLSQFSLGQSLVALEALALSVIVEVLVAAWALKASGEKRRLIIGVLGLRLIWRPIMLWVAVTSMGRFVRGKAVSWRKLRRTNTVRVTTI